MGTIEDTLDELASSRAVYIHYTNWRGETAWRHILPLEIRWRYTDWHPQAQYLLRARDLDRKAERDFAMKDISAWQLEAPPQEPCTD